MNVLYHRGHDSRNRPSRQTSSNVVFLCPRPAADPARAYQTLTHAVFMKQYRDGTLNPAVLDYMLAGIGIWP